MTKTYIDTLPNSEIVRKPIDKEMCDGCGKVFEVNEENFVCEAYIDPSVFAKRGGCALKTNNIIEGNTPKKSSVKRKFKRAKI